MGWAICSSNATVAEGPVKGPRFHPKLLRAYEIPTKPVGEGGFGVVYLATHLKTREKHAIKVIGATADSAEVVAHEVAIMQALSKRPSPHIVRIFGYEKDTWQHYLVLQACEGGELFDRIAERAFTEAEAAAAIAHVLTGLQACHDAGICHRDMKPENVLYATRAPNSPLLITDFGLSCRFKPGKKAIRDWCGTTPYMAPEVFVCASTKAAYSCECDLWSTGVLVYILLTGYMPFDGSEKAVEVAVLAGRYSLSEKIVGTMSEQAKSFLAGLLTVDPDKRLTAASALAHPWISAREKLPPSQVNPQVVERLKRFAVQSRLEKRLRFVVAQTLSIDEIAKLKVEFDALDTDKTGKISSQEMQSFLLANKENANYVEIAELIKSIDVDSDGQINIEEFAAAALDVRMLVDDEKLRAVFAAMDSNGDGQLSLAELTGQLDGDPVVYDLIAEGDVDRDGKLSLDEFRAVMKKHIMQIKRGFSAAQHAAPPTEGA